MQTYENFISYRRKDASLEVKNIYDALINRGYSTFCDIYSLGSGQFNSDLMIAIDNCTNFILVLGTNSLEHCSDESDWVRCEIKEALAKKKNIICVFVDDFCFPDQLPSDIDDIRYQNGLHFDVFYFDTFIDKLISQFFVSEDSRSESDENSDFIIIDGTIVKYVGNASIVNIPSKVRTIGAYAFKDQTKITKIVLPEGLIEIHDSAFERCINITYLALPETLRKIGKKAFCRCYNLAYISIGDGIEAYGEECFSFCGKLKVITLSSSACDIHPSAFNNCSMLMELHIDEGNKHYASIAGILYDKKIERVIRCPENYVMDIVSLPGSVKELGPWSFSRCTKLIDIALPRGLEIVCAHAFQDSCNIASLSLGDAIKRFDVSAIDGWNNRQKILMSRKFNPLLKYNIEQKLTALRSTEKTQIEYKYCQIKTAFESEEEASKMAKMLLDNRLIVSGQIKHMRSLYIWEEELSSEEEYELTCYTESALYSEIEQFIISHHSYELCELVCLPIIDLSDAFAKWISEYTGKIQFDE